MSAPSELRKDPVAGRWVVIACERSKRPDDFRPSQPEKAEPAGFCPFCSGNEAKTPPEVFAFRDPGTAPDHPGWRVRVVSNKFPALTRGEAPPRRIEGLYEAMDGVGVHEVIIESPDHGRELADLPDEAVTDVLRAYRERVRSIAAESQYHYIQVFKNKGREAGASLSHPHSQIVATPIVPKRVKEELYGTERRFRKDGACVLCRIRDAEIETGTRFVWANERFAALVPFASRFPFETQIHPRRHWPYFLDATDEDLASLAQALKAVLGRLKAVLRDPPFNLVLHQAPHAAQALGSWPKLEQFYHWHIEIIPVLTRVAGFEWGTGFYINPVAPEAAAGFLRAGG